MRHATVIRDYLAVTRAVDLDRARARPGAPRLDRVDADRAVALEALVYVTLQEVATRDRPRQHGPRLDDPEGRAIMTRVAADENLHHLFYRDLVVAALDVDPAATVLAIEAQARHFTMPGTSIPGFGEHATAIAEAGIYSATMLHQQVLVPVLLGHWHLDDVRRPATPGGGGPGPHAALRGPARPPRHPSAGRGQRLTSGRRSSTRR